MSPQPLDADRWRRLGELFDELVELPAGERAPRLAVLAAADPALHAAVARLLAADSGLGGVLETPIELDEGALELLEPREPMPERAGPYRLLAPLGRGRV